VRFGEIGLERERTLVARNGLAVTLEAVQCVAEVIVRLGIFRLECECALIASDRLLMAAEFVERVRKVKMKIGKVGF